jgi:hypothetical protein
VTSYTRPAVEAPTFRDSDGAVVPFGHRWNGSPPEDTYSVDTHPERFAPLHDVADALIAHLRATYDVEVDEGPDVAADLLHDISDDTVRAVRVRPKAADSAALTFVFTTYPGIHLHAGLLHDFRFPSCGCDACDSTWDGEADELEQQVLAVVTGNYRESVDRGLRPWLAHRFSYPDGAWQGGRGPANSIPRERFTAAKPILRSLTAGWAAWPELPSR